MPGPDPDPPEDRRPNGGATRPGASPGASGPGTPGYEGEVTVGDDGYDPATSARTVADRVDELDREHGLDDPGRVADATSRHDDDPGAATASNQAAMEGEAPTG